MNGNMYGYGGLYDLTSGPGGEDDPQEEQENEEIAEAIAESALNEQETSGYYSDSGAIMLPDLGQIAKKVGGTLQGLLGFQPPPARVKKIQQKVAAKLPAKAATRPARRIQPPRQRLDLSNLGARLVQPMQGPPARVSQPVRNVKDLMNRCVWAQLASLTSAPVVLGIGVTTSTTLSVTRTGWVLDWSTNSNNGDVLASNLTYAQQPQTIFSATPLSLWGPAAANPSPIQPLFVTMPATLPVTLQNINAAAQTITWQMSGIPAEHVSTAMMDPDVAKYLAGIAPELARLAQAGGFNIG